MDREKNSISAAMMLGGACRGTRLPEMKKEQLVKHKKNTAPVPLNTQAAS